MSQAATRRVLLDVTQYVNWPATSGVQRVLQHLAECWSGRLIGGRFGFVEHDRFVTGPVAELGSVIGSTFGAPGTTAASDVVTRSEAVKDALRYVADDVISAQEVEDSFAAYLLPEPTLRAENLAVATRLQGSPRTVPFFLYYDALPLTQPQFFPGLFEDQMAVVRYHRAMARADNIAFISRAVRDEFERRIARRTPLNAIVARPGADGLRRVSELPFAKPTFAILGTVEPRKGHRVVLDAFERLWAAGRDYHLMVLGLPGSEDVQLHRRLREHSRAGGVTWIEQPDDGVVASTLARASAMVFTSAGEGYGLPPLEALAVGCPVIVSADLPALEDLPNGGQIRLDSVSPETVASAVETLAEQSTNAAHRRALGDLRLPTWKQFADAVEHWIASVLDERHNDGAGRATP